MNLSITFKRFSRIVLVNNNHLFLFTFISLIIRDRRVGNSDDLVFSHSNRDIVNRILDNQ